MALERVAALVLPGVAPFELGVMCEVFGTRSQRHGRARDRLPLVTPQPGVVDTSSGSASTSIGRLAAALDADLICVPATPRIASDDPGQWANCSRERSTGALG